MNAVDRGDLSTLLESVDCGEYVSLFEQNEITPDLISSLDKDALKEIGVRKVGDRLRLQILIQMMRLERIRKNVPIKVLSSSVDLAAKSVSEFDISLNKSKNITGAIDSRRQSDHYGKARDTALLGVITNNGEVRDVEIALNSLIDVNVVKRTIITECGFLSQDLTLWHIYCIDYEKGNGQVQEICITMLADLIRHFDAHKELERLIVCRTGESVSIDAVNTSNKIHRGMRQRSKTIQRIEPIEDGVMSQERKIHPFMGGRPPSQLISGNLREYFPDLANREIKDIKRKSIRMSMYSNKMMNRLSKSAADQFAMSNKRDSIYSRLSHLSVASSRMSMISAVSYGVGMPMQMSSSNNLSLGGLSITEGERPNSDIELMDESDDEEIGDEEDLMTIISEEVANGPSVWHKGPKIGQGSFGNVYLGLNGLTGELMAIKQVDIPQNETEKSKRMMVTALQQEIFLLKDLSHENIVRYLGSNEDSTNMYIFLEYIPGGSVSSMLKMYGPFEEELIRNFTKQVLVGLTYLHSKGIVHRDIKGGNILVDNNGNVKIGDFGISKKITPEDEDVANSVQPTKNKRSSLQGSVFWMAPEVVKQVAYTSKADVWSVGCLVVEMYTGTHPYPGLSPMQALFQIGTGRAQPGVPERAQGKGEDSGSLEFFSKVFATDYTSRWTATQLLGLKFVHV
jgi:mitogen-activated protein kinase kinase kinase